MGISLLLRGKSRNNVANSDLTCCGGSSTVHILSDAEPGPDLPSVWRILMSKSDYLSWYTTYCQQGRVWLWEYVPNRYPRVRREALKVDNPSLVFQSLAPKYFYAGDCMFKVESHSSQFGYVDSRRTELTDTDKSTHITGIGVRWMTHGHFIRVGLYLRSSWQYTAMGWYRSQMPP